MATYNGEKFVLEQMASILEQLTPDDEAIVIDDSSSDGTVKLLRGMSDPRIKIYLNERNRGSNYSFGRAIALANNDIVFMSDQDDIWMAGRVLLMKEKLLDTGALLVSSNFACMDMNGRKISFSVDGVKASNSCKHFKNILDILMGRTNYFGCAMAFRKNLLELILPIPSFVESHDLWIALAGNLKGSNAHLDEKTLKKRVHSSNVSITKRNLLLKIRARFIFGISIMILLFRNFSNKIKR
jgi:glycosyltransferase involved in cell wall biosynthesis